MLHLPCLNRKNTYEARNFGRGAHVCGYGNEVFDKMAGELAFIHSIFVRLELERYSRSNQVISEDISQSKHLTITSLKANSHLKRPIFPIPLEKIP